MPTDVGSSRRAPKCLVTISNTALAKRKEIAIVAALVTEGEDSGS